MVAAGGIVTWKAVSKQATCGTPGSARRDDVERGERAGLVQRREVGERLELGEHAVVDPHRVAEALAAVDHAVPDGVDALHAGEGVDQPGVVVPRRREVELGRRPGRRRRAAAPSGCSTPR